MVLCQRLKLLRNDKKLTQKELAIELNVSREVIVNWESDTRYGEPDIEMLIKIANFYGVSIDYLLVRYLFRNLLTIILPSCLKLY